MTVPAWGLAALAYQVASRLAYVGYVGVALRRQERRGRFTRHDGVEAGFRRFRRAASRLMTNDGVSFVAACLLGRGTLPAVVPREAAIAGGTALVLLGIGTKLWARATIGARAYYWHNFFTAGAGITPARTGPYRFLGNPMYTVGYLHTYGLALVTGSLPGLVAALFDQFAILVFYRLVERPHFEKHRVARPRGEVVRP